MNIVFPSTIGIVTAIISSWLGFGIETVQHWAILAIGIASYIAGLFVGGRD